MKGKAFRVAVYEINTDKLLEELEVKTTNIIQLRQMCHMASIAVAMMNKTEAYYTITKTE